MIKAPRFLLALAVVLPAMLACNSAPSKPQPGADFDYAVNGVAIADHDRDRATVAVEVLRDSSVLAGATIRFNGDTLEFANAPLGGLFYSRTQDTATTLAGTDLRLIIQDSSVITDTLLATVPDTFSILTVEPPNRIVTGLQPVSLTWSGSDNAEGYVLATVLRQNRDMGTGYSQYVTSLSPAGTLPPEAFSLSVGPNPDTGWYYIYVYAYIGAPDSVFTRTLLPVPFPNDLPDNISDDPWYGQFGAITIARRDSVHIVIQP